MSDSNESVQAPDAFSIAARPIGSAHKPYLIGELSGNHNGNLDRAIALVDAIADAGADAVKLQTYTADTITIDADGPGFTIEGGPWNGRRLYDLYREAHTPWEWHPVLFERARERGLAAFSSPFDATAVDFLESIGAPAYKIASFEVIDIPLIQKAAATGKPLIISSGMADADELAEAQAAALQAGANGVVLLHCVSGYPTPTHESNLATIPALQARFGGVIGLSDHTLGTTVPVAAVALGASVIEKHVTLSRDDGGVDSAFSLEPPEFARMVVETEQAWSALGVASMALKPSEAGSRLLRRSLYATQAIAEGERFTPQNVRSIRPGFGLPPKRLAEVLGTCASRSIRFGEPLTEDMIAQD